MMVSKAGSSRSTVRPVAVSTTDSRDRKPITGRSA
ncbi:Uncharacterised protein [Mycobacteroides abscessus subsp. abscessus]|nr:Uncharacterised protein [Mycobacteroides abscessus subsp. abscessus]SKV34679.1 Uncharacterised protein [Mycobacteroides abscessus subsp. abscessus]